MKECKVDTTKVKWFSDPGHGWLRVPLEQIVELGIKDDVSPFSYMDETYAYLEEDQDATHWLNTAFEGDVEAYRNFSNQLDDEYQDRTFIRNLAGYHANTVVARAKHLSND